jgi:DNA-binding NarL/FixJ family response regulator
VKVVVISGLSDGTEEDAAHAAGATGFLFKGGLHDEIADAIVDAHLEA